MSNQVKRARSAARQRGLPATLTAKDWRRALHYFNYRCAIWRVSLIDPLTCKLTATIDHWRDMSKGGGTTRDNILPTCRTCNHQRSCQEVRPWLLKRYEPEIAEAILARIEAYFAQFKDAST